jgi:hypothetical protein
MARRLTFGILLFSLVFAGCGGREGEFVFKRFKDDAYHRMRGDREFPSDETIRWVYRFNRSPGDRKVGIFLKTRKVVWVEVRHRVEEMTAGTRHIYGEISGLEPGEYAILLVDVEENEIFDRLAFRIYKPEGLSY